MTNASFCLIPFGFRRIGRLSAVAIALIAAAGCLSRMSAAAPELRRHLDLVDGTTARAVQVADGSLAWTGQIFAWNETGSVTGTAEQQAELAVKHLRTALVAAGGSLQTVARVNTYVVRNEVAPVLLTALRKAFSGTPPTVTVVGTPLAEPGALLALDAVAAIDGATSTITLLTVEGLPSKASGRHVACVPAGRKVFISGQAEPADSLRVATRLTMASLGESLSYLGLDKRSVVQVKAFAQPFSQYQDALEEIAAFFGADPMPPVILMAWTNGLPTEIELIASGGRGPAEKAGESVWFSTLPKLAASPRFSRAAIVEPGAPLIFTTGLIGSAGGGARAELRDIFSQLGTLLFDTGSSYRTLVKATYFNTDAAGPKVLAEVRGVYFDPTRPPAASAVGVAQLGHAARASSLDMIAVPVATPK